MADSVLLAKLAALERCVGRARELYGGDPATLDDQTVEDAVVLNLQRACETAIDLAMHVVARDRLGLPESSRRAFALLESARVLDADLSARMQRMVGFRNAAMHADQELSRVNLRSILAERLGDFEEFAAVVARGASREAS